MTVITKGLVTKSGPSKAKACSEFIPPITGHKGCFLQIKPCSILRRFAKMANDTENEVQSNWHKEK